MTFEAGIILIDPPGSEASNLADRLRMQGYAVTVAHDAAEGARMAMADPPAAVVADLWMPSVSGVQLCRLLRAEASTENVPVILRGPDGQRNRFWAERAGAAAYVTRGRMGDLVRALARAIEATPPMKGGAFCDLHAHKMDVRDRIAAHLDRALFESVLAAEVRALSTCGEFERLFDLFSQFVSRVTSYRWLALSTVNPARVGVHSHPTRRADAVQEALAVLSMPDETTVVSVTDEDAFDDATGPAPIVCPITLGGLHLGHFTLAIRAPKHEQDEAFVAVVARELAGPLRMASLLEESQRMATVDPLTKLMNRRAFLQSMALELARAERHGHPTSVILFDVDHFKQINDRNGHAAGDTVLAAIGKLLRDFARKGDHVGRWGGEEFLMLLYRTDVEAAQDCAERLREAVIAMVACTDDGTRIPVTVSLGVAVLRRHESAEAVIDRADRAMYEAKSAGRDRVIVATGDRLTAESTRAPAARVA